MSLFQDRASRLTRDRCAGWREDIPKPPRQAAGASNGVHVRPGAACPSLSRHRQASWERVSPETTDAAATLSTPHRRNPLIEWILEHPLSPDDLAASVRSSTAALTAALGPLIPTHPGLRFGLALFSQFAHDHGLSLAEAATLLEAAQADVHGACAFLASVTRPKETLSARSLAGADEGRTC